MGPLNLNLLNGYSKRNNQVLSLFDAIHSINTLNKSTKLEKYFCNKMLNLMMLMTINNIGSIVSNFNLRTGKLLLLNIVWSMVKTNKRIREFNFDHFEENLLVWNYCLTQLYSPRKNLLSNTVNSRLSAQI